jgi:hypothetical protein
MTTALTKYDALCRALAEAATVDEVKHFHDEAKAIAAYARQARNRELEAQCVEIRMRATRRLGVMVREQKRTIGLAKGGRPKTGLSDNPVSVPTFGSQGIDKNLAQQARTLSDIPEEKFEARVAEAREVALGVVDKVVRRQAHEDRREERAQIDANPTAYEQAQKANKARSKAAKLSRMAPHTLEGWRAGYLNAVKHLAPDIADEHQLLWEAFQELMGERDKQRRSAQ